MPDDLPPIDPTEWILRRIPNRPDYYDPALQIPVTPLSFRPNRQDSDGLSFYRERFLSPIQLANSASKPADCYVVARIAASSLVGLGLTLVVSQQQGDLPGHLVIPELSWQHYEDKSKQKNIKELNHKLAILASSNIICNFGDPDKFAPEAP